MRPAKPEHRLRPTLRHNRPLMLRNKPRLRQLPKRLLKPEPKPPLKPLLMPVEKLRQSKMPLKLPEEDNISHPVLKNHQTEKECRNDSTCVKLLIAIKF